MQPRYKNNIKHIMQYKVLRTFELWGTFVPALPAFVFVVLCCDDLFTIAGFPSLETTFVNL